MTYKQKLTKIGNSVGIIIPKPLLDILDLDVGQDLYIENVQDKIVIEKEKTSTVSPEFLKIAENIGKKYKAVFSELANK
ncbi:MAG: hypothetical protein UU77_C0007G0005 [candidate division WWE3 bacterium GW2011_GWC1_41_7]|uniref:SpoVT-AbrB domain-containing protein n=4 Tax=Katanobacteria TaxID=422282 RepID=A0A0G0X8C5_UNCKA|nr:MAG: hypothetical protein UU72_C0017G0001 [candidate division WWE3 bacterium GW2011_GWB1_41_6]KKS21160.1 MAG: hypothetical protein UU77_C0007G0005 [candidate division WWE3 bacterium GW2011_GWC1_41_7]KKS22015.1 MAG: hypothetical protein UU80_C0015G0010 [candidate division WWE3 bacterium GW2011_GWA1_41_8]OGC58171.1 MAG: hypothetical protein A2976_01000 [candidate division WWE3 bacterium RIFCSPLOWO2_01_FULL_41_9]